MRQIILREKETGAIVIGNQINSDKIERVMIDTGSNQIFELDSMDEKEFNESLHFFDELS